MKIGTDGVLLGAWVNLEEEKSILDVGTGTGVIALMMAQRSNAVIDAVEIDKNAAGQSLENTKKSPWNSRINVFCTPLQDFNSKTQYDLIISNPPYFSNSLKNLIQEKSNARHDVTLTLNDFLSSSHRLLKPSGRLALILPFDKKAAFTKKAREYKLNCIRKTNVRPTPQKQAKRVLLEFSYKKLPLTEDYLTIENNKRHDYTQEYIDYTKDFYLYL